MDRMKIVQDAISYLGVKKGSAIHKHIIDTYNDINPLPYGYKLSYKDPWCAGFVSAIEHECGSDSYAPLTCSCNKYIDQAKRMDIWVEDDKYIPKPGDKVLYDWQDDKNNYATTDNQGQADHIGIVVNVANGIIYVVEGNMGNESIVGSRELKVNGRYIRGFVTPKYEDVKPTSYPATIKKGSKGINVTLCQQRLVAKGYNIGKSGVDGDFGPDTERAVKDFQHDTFPDNPKSWDGIVGPNTWAKLLG